MNTSRILLTAAALIGLAACSDSDDSSSGAPATAATTAADAGGSTTAAATDAADATIVLSDSSLGQILTTADGMTLYLFTPDTPTTSACTGGCLSAWPALTGEAVVGEGLDGAMVAAFDRGDGTMQLTYNGHPLYLFSGDTQPGDVTGQGSGGSWFAVTAEGSAVSG